MLKSPIAMFQSILVLTLIFFAQTADISIIFPLSGDTLRGQVEIMGNLNVPNFMSAELAFSYAESASNPADSWFVIQTFPQPPAEPTLAIWDTTQLTDGNYTLHLRVFFQDGSSQDIVISDLKIHNDVPLVVTVSPTATDFFESITVTPLPAVTIQPTVTALPTFPSPIPLPSNPASVTSSSIYSNFARGAFVVFVLFLFFSLLLRLRKNR